MNISKLAKTAGIKLKGIIHVGAHEAQEAKDYIGINTLWVEPIPELAKQLKDNGFNVLEMALLDYVGETDFYITEFTQGSSVLKPLEHKINKTIKIKINRLDNVLEAPEKYNCLVLDVQGAELMVLKGANLKHFNLIICETSNRQRYERAPIENEVIEYLQNNGFKYLFSVNHSTDGVIKDNIFICKTEQL